MAPRKTAADYAAIAVAPVLIFLMISSLANFLILMFYRGGFQSRLSWTVLCFTMGIVAVARIAIERDRVYSYGYAAALGLATLLVMARLVDSLVFSVFILVVVGYLADVIVRDCTLIDENVDASGEGLVDSGHLFLRKQVQLSADKQHDSETGAAPSKRRTSQPGRTVMYLALGALPLFGLGQFFLRNDAASWARAKYLLAFYLFASLSLLVTTSFVGLRRYLRQRQVEMPREVAIAWLSTGLVLIAAVLGVAYFSPMPGRVLASFELPTFDSPGNTFASRFGWGDEGADHSNPDASGTTNDPNADSKEIQGSVDRKGGKPGGSGEGDRKDGPAGRKQGGKKSGGSQKSDSSRQGKQESGQQSKQGGERGQATPKQNQSQDQSSSDSAGRDPSSGKQSNSQPQSDSGNSDSGNSDDNSDSGQPDSDEGESPAESSDSQSSEDSAGDSQSPDSQSPDSQSSQSRQSPSGSGPSQDSSSASQSSVGETISGAVSMLGSVLKFLIMVVLVAIIAIFLWRNWERIRQWFLDFLGPRKSDAEVQHAAAAIPTMDTPPRPFSSFRNPIGRETDLRRVMIVTFQAFEAWSREFGVMRKKEETPAEFTRRVARALPPDSFSQLPAHASQVVEAYNRIVYGRGNATQRDVAAAEQVWNVMRSQS